MLLPFLMRMAGRAIVTGWADFLGMPAGNTVSIRPANDDRALSSKAESQPVEVTGSHPDRKHRAF